jgi:thiamine biosynthesis lipoprotein
VRQAAAAAVLLAIASIPVASDTQQLVTRDAYLMGTRAQLATYAITRDAGLAALESGLRVLEDAERELSTWRADSDISALNRHPVGAPWQATPRVCRVLADVIDWSAATGSAFDPTVGRLLEAWDIHGGGRVPDRDALSRARSASGLALLTFDPRACTVTRTMDVTVDVGAFGKGEALDRVAAALGATPWMVDLGGQVSAGGAPPPGGAWPIAIAHPRRRDQPHLTVRLTGGSFSTSAGSERDLHVNGVRIGHILDPRTGTPAPFDGSVTVWHQRGLVADILSTALYVLGPDAGLRWAEDRGVAAAYLIPDAAGVRIVTTRAFAPLIARE